MRKTEDSRPASCSRPGLNPTRLLEPLSLGSLCPCAFFEFARHTLLTPALLTPLFLPRPLQQGLPAQPPWRGLECSCRQRMLGLPSVPRQLRGGLCQLLQLRPLQEEGGREMQEPSLQSPHPPLTILPLPLPFLLCVERRRAWIPLARLRAAVWKPGSATPTTTWFTWSRVRKARPITCERGAP